MAVTQKMNFFDPGFLFTPSDTFSLGRTVSPQYKTSQTDRRQTDRQTTHRAKGKTDSTVGQKSVNIQQRYGQEYSVLLFLRHGVNRHTGIN